MNNINTKKHKAIAIITMVATASILFLSSTNAHADEIITTPNQPQIDRQIVTTTYGMEWIGDVLGAIGNAAHPVDPKQVVDQLNGRYPRRGPVHSCPPGGTGGTPNAC